MTSKSLNQKIYIPLTETPIYTNLAREATSVAMRMGAFQNGTLQNKDDIMKTKL